VQEYSLNLSEVMNSAGVAVSAPLALALVKVERQGAEVIIMVNTSSGLFPDKLYRVDVVARSAINSVTTDFLVCKQAHVRSGSVGFGVVLPCRFVCLFPSITSAIRSSVHFPL